MTSGTILKDLIQMALTGYVCVAAAMLFIGYKPFCVILL